MKTQIIKYPRIFEDLMMADLMVMIDNIDEIRKVEDDKYICTYKIGDKTHTSKEDTFLKALGSALKQIKNKR